MPLGFNRAAPSQILFDRCLFELHGNFANGEQLLINFLCVCQEHLHYCTTHQPSPFFSQAKLMFDGEMASLEAILKTETVRVPKPMKVIQLDTGGCVFVMEHLDMRSLSK